MTNNIIKLFIFIIISSVIIHFFSFKQIVIGIGFLLLALIALFIIFIIFEWIEGEYDNYFEKVIDPKIMKIFNIFKKK